MQNIHLNLSPGLFGIIVAGLCIVESNNLIKHTRNLLGINKSQFNSKWNVKANKEIFARLGIKKEPVKKGSKDVIIRYTKNEIFENTLEEICREYNVSFIEVIRLCQRIKAKEFYKELD